MKTRVHTVDLQEIMVDAEYPLGFQCEDSGIVERTFSIGPFLGSGIFTELFFGGVIIRYGDVALKRHTQLQIETDVETVEMHFTLSGDTLTEDTDTGNQFELSCNQHNIFYTNGFKGNSEWSKNSKIQVFEVNLLPSFFEKYLPDNTHAFESFRKHLDSSKQSQLCAHNLQITPKMLLVIREILNSQRQGMFKKMFIEAKVIELLMLQFEQISEHQCEVFCSLRKTDIDKMHQVKEIILNDLSTPCSLIGLAQQVGTNEFTLKKGFKELFGTTVFGFWNELKMQESKNLLLEQNLTVAEVSEKVGYKNPQHFSTAFRKYFGFSPSQLKG